MMLSASVRRFVFGPWLVLALVVVLAGCESGQQVQLWDMPVKKGAGKTEKARDGAADKAEAAPEKTSVAEEKTATGERPARTTPEQRERRRKVQKRSQTMAVSPPREIEYGSRIAILLPLSGEHGDAGRALLNAAQMALFDVAGEDFELMPIDTKGTREGAEVAAIEAVNQGASLVLGPLFSHSVKGAAPVTREAGINMVALSNDTTLAGDGVYLLGFLPGTQVARVVRHVRGQGDERFAGLVPDTGYGRTVLDAYRQAVKNAGGEMVRVRLYDPDAESYSELVKRFARYGKRHRALVQQRKKLKARGDQVAQQALARLEGRETYGGPGFDAVLIPDKGTRLRSVAALLPYFDVSPQEVTFMGTMLWNDPTLAREPALQGGLFAGSPHKSVKQFEKRYEKLYDSTPPRIAPLGYDATALAAVLARGGDGPDFSAEALTAPSGFVGINGLFRLTPKGLPDRRLAVMALEQDGIKVVAPAARTFATN